MSHTPSRLSPLSPLLLTFQSSSFFEVSHIPSAKHCYSGRSEQIQPSGFSMGALKIVHKSLLFWPVKSVSVPPDSLAAALQFFRLSDCLRNRRNNGFVAMSSTSKQPQQRHRPELATGLCLGKGFKMIEP